MEREKRYAKKLFLGWFHMYTQINLKPQNLSWTDLVSRFDLPNHLSHHLWSDLCRDEGTYDGGAHMPDGCFMCMYTRHVSSCESGGFRNRTDGFGMKPGMNWFDTSNIQKPIQLLKKSRCC